jgi:hypothetical protein
MPRLLKLTTFALVIFVGVWLAFSGVYSFCVTEIGGTYVTTLEECFFVPNIGGWIGRVWYAGIAVVGGFLVWVGALSLLSAMRLGKPCACFSGRIYRHCCFRRERGLLLVGGMTAVVLLITRALDIPLPQRVGILAAAALAFWLVSRRYSHRCSENRKL